MNSKITISGNIISELSEKIPSNIIALNELIKNSYDAGAKKVSIKIDSINKKLYINDDGSGMDISDIDKLFHISKSEKKYGELNEYNRITQGSKGLGFLSVFKFGKYVVWKTKKDKGLSFSVDYSKLIINDDISRYPIDIIEDDSFTKGTSIEIDITDYNLNSLVQYFSDEKNYKKVINAFDDKSFEIELMINDNVFSSNTNFLIKDHFKERQLYYVTFNSEEQKINFFFNDNLILSEKYKFSDIQYKLDIELAIYQLKTGEKSKVSKLFYNNQDDLTPLIYVNTNFFNNYDMFDPNIMKNKKTSESLNQMIGYIRINSSDSLINFNSDRSQFLQNELTDSIKEYLKNINIYIQRIGSKNKKYLMNSDFLKHTTLSSEYKNADTEKLKENIKDDFTFKEKVSILKINNKIKYSVFDKHVYCDIMEPEKADKPDDNNQNDDDKQNDGSDKDESQNDNTDQKSIPAIIKLYQNMKKIPIPSNQMNLLDEINYVKNSKDEIINKNNIIIKIDNVVLNGSILSSINEVVSKKIEFSYTDPITGPVIEILLLEFFQPQAKLNASSSSQELLSLPTNVSYNITFNPIICNLTNQLNSLKINEYCEIISCCLRSLFEISIDTIIKSNKFNSLNLQNEKKLEERVKTVINFIGSNNKHVGEISKATSIDYISLGNMLNPTNFGEAIINAHLGAHKSKTYITETETVNLAKKASLFLVVVNEMINNSAIV